MYVTTALMTIALASPQEAIRIDDDLTCGSCRIRLTEISTLGGAGGNELLADQMGEQVVRDSLGAYWLFSYALGGLWAFDVDGRARLVGQRGQGPDEIDGVAGIGLTPSGDLLVVDRGNSRLVTVDPAGETDAVFYHREGSSVSAVAPLAGDTVLIGTMSRKSGAFGTPIQAVSLESGRVVGALGAPTEQYRAQLTERHQERRLSVRGATVVASAVWMYHLDVFDWPSRAKTRSVTRDARWFPSLDLRQVDPPRTRPASRVLGLEITSDSTVLVLSARPRPNWITAYADARRGPERHSRPASNALVYEGVLEHLDIRNGHVLAREVVRGSPMAFVSGADRHQIAVLRDEELTPLVLIYDVTVSSQPPPAP